MSTVRYSKIPTSDNREDDRMAAFDFSSPFSYDESENTQWKYKSAFTYNSTTIQIENESQVTKSAPQLASDNMARLFVIFCFFVVYFVTFPVMVWFSFRKIKTHERFVVFRLGRLHKCKGPGFAFMLPLLDRCHKIDVRLKAFSVPPKQIITGDGAIIEVGAEIYFQIIDAEKSVTNVQDLNRSTRILLQTALCNILAKKALAEIEAERRNIAETVMKNSNETCVSWGVEIQRAELSQIKVLNDPPPKPAPTLMMPPGLMEGGKSQGLSSVLMHLASAVMSKKGPEQTEAITEVFKAFSGGDSGNSNGNLNGMPPVENPDVENQPSLEVSNSVKESGMSHQYSPGELISSIRNALSEDLVQKVEAIFQFEISGSDGGTFYLDLLNGSGAIGVGPSPTGDSDVTLTMTMDDLQAMLQGQLQPFHAYMSGRLKVSGDTRTAMRLEELVDKMRTNSQAAFSRVAAV